jgi:transposase-like protein
MNTYKRHRLRLGAPTRHHQLRNLALLPIQPQARENSHRDIEDLLAERGITVSREAIRLWCIKFGAIYARKLRRKYRGFGDSFYIDEVFAGVPYMVPSHIAR